MAWTLGLDEARHDLVIRNGRFTRVNGADEVRQRIKVTLWHYFSEYFLDVTDGTPWYESILGRKSGTEDVSLILRARILSVPGVLRIRTFSVTFDGITRTYSQNADVDVQPGPGDPVTLISQEFAVNPERVQ